MHDILFPSLSMLASDCRLHRADRIPLLYYKYIVVVIGAPRWPSHSGTNHMRAMSYNDRIQKICRQSNNTCCSVMFGHSGAARRDFSSAAITVYAIVKGVSGFVLRMSYLCLSIL